MRKLILQLEINVRDLSDVELALCQVAREDADLMAEEVEAEEIARVAASMFTDGSDAATEAFAGSDIYLKFAGATVLTAEFFTVTELED